MQKAVAKRTCATRHDNAHTRRNGFPLSDGNGDADADKDVDKHTASPTECYGNARAYGHRDGNRDSYRYGDAPSDDDAHADIHAIALAGAAYCDTLASDRNAYYCAAYTHRYAWRGECAGMGQRRRYDGLCAGGPVRDG